MNKIMTAMLLCISLIAAAQKKGMGAQPKLSIDERVAKVVSVWDKATGGLNDEQKSKISTLSMERFKKMEEFRTANKGQKDAIKAEVKKVKENFRNEVKAMLTEEQKSKMKAFAMTNRKDKKAKKEGKGKGKKEEASGDDSIDMDDLEIE